jgi:iron complex outermembrane recepter protein
MTRSRKRKLQRTGAGWAGVPLAAAMLAGAGAAHAQQAAEPATLEEIVVTAQKRSEDLQKVPISMQVLGGEKLEQLEVASFEDYAKFLPSVSFQTLGPGQGQLYFRGIASGGDGLHAGSASATGTYLDETPVTIIGNSIDLHVYDIQRVEALAGPQGTLYGASSLSGTLRIITNKPDPSKFSGGYDAEINKYGKGDAGGTFQGFVNVPLAERAAVRLVGYYEKDGGYINNVPASRTYTLQASDGTFPDPPITINNHSGVHDFVKSHFNDVETYGGRAALKINLNDSWTVTPTALYQTQKTSGIFAFDPKYGDLNVTEFGPDFSTDHWYQTALTVEGKIGNFDLLYTGGYFGRNSEFAADYSEYSVAYDYNGYSRLRDNAGNLIDPTQATTQIDRYTKLTHELRLSSPASDRFRFVVGAFYQRQTNDIRNEFIIKGLGNDPNGFNFAVPGQANILYLTQQLRVDRDYALFGDATFDITDKLKVSAGLREFKAKNTLYGFFGFNDLYVDTNNGDSFSHGSGTSSCFTPIVYSGSNMPCANTDKLVDETGETHRVNLQYQVDPSRMVYLTYSTGFRPGGNNRRVGLPSYASDTITNYELGWKTSWLDRRVRLNGAVFYEDWKGVQLGVTGPNGITDIWNVGNASVKGVESDINWLATDHVELSASATYVDAKTTTDFCGEDLSVAPTDPRYGLLRPSCPVDPNVPGSGPSSPSGSRLPVTPNFKGNATARYKFDVGNYKSFAQISALHQSSSRSALENHPQSLMGSAAPYTSFDFSVGTGMNNWSAELFVINAFDERGELARFGECGADYCYQNARVYPVKPRLFGIKFGQKF